MFNRLTIAQRLSALVAALLAITILISLFGQHAQKGILDDFATTYNDRVVCLKQLKTVADSYAVGIVDGAHKLHAGAIDAAGFLGGIDAAQVALKKQWGDYRATYLTDEEKTLADQAEAAMRHADASVARLKSLAQSGDRAAMQLFLDKEMYPAIDPIANRIAALIDLQLRVAAEEFVKAQERAAASRVVAIALLICGVALGAVLSLIIIRSLMAELGGEPRDVVALTERIANGDLSQRLQVKAGDQHSVVASMARMQSGLIRMVRAMQQIISQLSANATELAAAAEQVAASAEEQTRAASSMSASVEQLSVSICSVDDNTTDVATESVSTGDLATRGESIIDQTLHTIESVADMARASQVQADLMSSRSQQISNVIQVIRDVADQTNLLALNAAIEAARAGEQGRGFAVVADEVRKLSERTAQSTSEIGASIREMLDSSAHVVQNIHHTVDHMEVGLQQASDARAAITGINDKVARVKQSLSAISVSLHEQQATGTGIAANVEKVAQMSEETSAAANQTADSASQMEQMSHELQSSINYFTLPQAGQSQSEETPLQTGHSLAAAG
ncbi:methyl-accepting chemotaxis protein [Chromobacterium haemolyticum]|uniref:Methyl-accepting chemotaxis protein n=1 Tax=Chromobacterium fluminis TaxID=3044269 RepID=A0ABX0L6L9_9NEIS|nr:methyl-accepting chemotaxis protein [Chromobacterium haemolyticum]NHR05262.1 methyl-accepting chemotaxis protein [Chromobacterium haemolyticum]